MYYLEFRSEPPATAAGSQPNPIPKSKRLGFAELARDHCTIYRLTKAPFAFAVDCQQCGSEQWSIPDELRVPVIWRNIHSKSSCDPTNKWFKQLQSDFMCSGCGALSREARLQLPEVQLERRPDSSMLNHVAGTAGIICNDFLALLEPHCSKSFSLGRIVDRRGLDIVGFTSFVPVRPILIRSSESRFRICDTCRRFVYTPLGQGHLDHILRESLPGDEIYGTDNTHLIVSAELASKLDVKKLRGVYIRPIQVLDRPLDGLDPLPASSYWSINSNDKFKELFPGMDLDDVRNGSWWEAKSHIDNSGEYDQLWRDFLDEDPTMDEVLDFARDLGRVYGFKVNW